MTFVIKNNKIYKYPSNTQIGEIRNNKIYKYPSNTQIGDITKIRSQIKDSQSTDPAFLVAAYNFLIKPIF